MILNEFLDNLKEYKAWQKDAKLQENVDIIINDVEEMIEEIKTDHIQGDVDQQKNDDKIHD